ncbi:hypothetical protein C8Q80DRAFT_1196960 [Daedaleopsis nitida]|nr:hypothetical protein C8Q80DRAFT_1196960 [Daedaleopsis nitida]
MRDIVNSIYPCVILQINLSDTLLICSRFLVRTSVSIRRGLNEPARLWRRRWWTLGRLVVSASRRCRVVVVPRSLRTITSAVSCLLGSEVALLPISPSERTETTDGPDPAHSGGGRTCATGSSPAETEADTDEE